MFPSEEAGDFFNNNVILLKYDLDLADPDDIQHKYPFAAYPTFVFVDGSGVEYSRFIGGDNDVKSFIERAQNAMKPENSWAYRNEKLKTDPSYIPEHIKFLYDMYLLKESNELLNDLFNSRSVSENFSDESIKLYNDVKIALSSPIVVFMQNNAKEVLEVMGEEGYSAFLGSRVNALLNAQLDRLISIKAEDFEKPESFERLDMEITKMNSDPLLKSKYAQFLADNFDNIKAKDVEAIFNNAKELLSGGQLGSADKTEVIGLSSRIARILQVTVDRDVSRQRSITLYELAIEHEKDPEALKRFQDALERIKNPRQRPGGRTVAAP